ncbi:MAG: CCA tRNA nucleotidyltransferase [Thermoplasmatota archaeon]
MKSLETRVLAEVTPDAEEERRVQAAARNLVERVRHEAIALGLEGEPLLVGSVAKGTHLRSPDIDVFFLFPPSTPREELEARGLALGERVLGGERRYAEHPYIRGVFEGFEAEVVPCYSVVDASKRMSAVDRTPFHTSFVRERLGVEQRDEVRLLKGFLKGIGAYGAEEAVRGFSGYLAELLVIKYGTFRGALEAAAGWPERVVLSLSEPYEGPEERGAPMVFVDPVDRRRNVASALSADNYALFTVAARSYLRKPSRRFFFPRPPRALSLRELAAWLRSRGTELLGIRLRTPDVTPDVYYSQLRKFERGILALCEEYGFRALGSSFAGQGEFTLFLFEFEVGRLPPVRSHSGPPPGNPRAGAFLKKWRASPLRRGALHIRDGVWRVEVRRDFTTPSALIRARIKELSLGKHLNKEVRRGYRLLIGKELLRRENALALTLHLDRRFPWER